MKFIPVLIISIFLINVSLCNAQTSIDPTTKPQRTENCPIGNSGQPEEPIGK